MAAELVMVYDINNINGVVVMILNILGYSLSVVWLTFLIFLWIIIAFWPASIAKQKGHSFLGWFILSLFFWWITLFIAIFFLEDKNKTANHQS